MTLGDDKGNDACENSYKTYCSEQNFFRTHESMIECSGVCHHENAKDFLTSLTSGNKIGKFKKCCDMYSFQNNCGANDEDVWNHRDKYPRLCGAQGNVTNFVTFKAVD